MKKASTQTSSFGTKGRINHDSSKFYKTRLYQELGENAVATNPDNEFPKEYLNKIICASSENMAVLPDACVDLMITSPPYNVSKEYDEDLSLQEYLQLLRNVFTEVYRVLVNGGRACINIANVGRKPYIPLSDYVSQMMIQTGFNMRGEIIWDKGASVSPSTAWGSWQSASNPILRDVHEYILVFSKGEYKKAKKDKENTISKENFIEWTKSVWSMNAERAKRIGHPAPFPEELPHRLIQLYSFKNDVVLDPFMGSGTTAVSALKSDRCFVGFEINEDYIKLANQRIEPILHQRSLF